MSGRKGSIVVSPGLNAGPLLYLPPGAEKILMQHSSRLPKQEKYFWFDKFIYWCYQRRDALDILDISPFSLAITCDYSLGPHFKKSPVNGLVNVMTVDEHFQDRLQEIFKSIGKARSLIIDFSYLRPDMDESDTRYVNSIEQCISNALSGSDKSRPLLCCLGEELFRYPTFRRFIREKSFDFSIMLGHPTLIGYEPLPYEPGPAINFAEVSFAGEVFPENAKTVIEGVFEPVILSIMYARKKAGREYSWANIVRLELLERYRTEFHKSRVADVFHKLIRGGFARPEKSEVKRGNSRAVSLTELGEGYVIEELTRARARLDFFASDVDRLLSGKDKQNGSAPAGMNSIVLWNLEDLVLCNVHYKKDRSEAKIIGEINRNYNTNISRSTRAVSRLAKQGLIKNNQGVRCDLTEKGAEYLRAEIPEHLRSINLLMTEFENLLQ